jgi:hypothetical protein
MLTAHIANLVNEPADMVGENVEVTAISSSFGMRPLNSRSLITRSLSRGVVSDCFHLSKAGSVYAIVGSFGTGKSWTLEYALQQALLYDGDGVVFFLHKEAEAMLCINLFKIEDVSVLLDPKESKLGGASYIKGRAMLVFAASNNGAHFSSDIFKTTGDAERHLSPYWKEELCVALPKMGCNDVNKALDQAKDVGMLPRYLVDDNPHLKRKSALR